MRQAGFSIYCKSCRVLGAAPGMGRGFYGKNKGFRWFSPHEWEFSVFLAPGGCGYATVCISSHFTKGKPGMQLAD